MADIRIKRVYDPPEAGDGLRVLVDRLWPRGLTKEKAAVDLWAKEVAPSTELRRWFHANRQLWPEFRARYLAELAQAGPALKAIVAEAGTRPITLLYAVKPPGHTHATVLQDVLRKL